MQYEICLALLSLQAYIPGDLAGHKFTRPEGRVQCEFILVIVWPLESLSKRSDAKQEQQINGVGVIDNHDRPLPSQIGSFKSMSLRLWLSLYSNNEFYPVV